MKEIGGCFWVEQLISNEYYKGLIPLNYARNALMYLLRARKIKRIYIPYYLCNSVSDMLEKNRYDFDYYRINPEFIPIFDKKLDKNEYLYIVNYYGQLTEERILSLKNEYINIILDNAHAFFQKPLQGIDTIYSCYKFFGVPDGAYLSTDVTLNEDLKVDISNDRMALILSRFEGKTSDYYHKFQAIKSLFKVKPLKYMSRLTHNILGAIDYERVRRLRNENYGFLDKQLKKQNKLKLIIPDGPFVYPLYIENGIEIRKKLAEKKIYIFTFWSDVLKDNPEGSIEYQYAANILPLPCDQRYNIHDMQYLLEDLMKFIRS